MKRTIALILFVLLLTGLAACSREESDVAQTPSPTVPAASSSSDTSLTGQKEPPASGTDAAPSGNYAAALEYVGRPVSELYAALGQPVETPSYGPSCLTEGAEDGILTYEDFYVWTVRTADEELVHDVYPAE